MRVLVVVAVGVGAVACGAFGSEGSNGPGGFTGPAVDLATNQQTPGAAVVDGTNVYWLNEASSGKPGSVMKVAKTGGTPFIVADNIAAPYALSSDATRLYFTDNDEAHGGSYQYLYRQDKGGGLAEKLQLNANDKVLGCSIQGGSIFWTLRSGGGTVGAIDESSWTSTSTVSVADNLGAVTVVVADPTHVFVGVAGEILMVNRSDKEKARFATVTDSVRALVLDESTTTLFWADGSSVSALDKNSAGGQPRVLGPAQDGPSAIAVDATNVYWANAGDGTIRKAPKAGGPITTLATGEGAPRGIAVDDSGVYWTNYADGRVRALRH